jgi:hypothetical protein
MEQKTILMAPTVHAITSTRPFISLEHGDQGKTYEVFLASFGPVALTGLGIEIDIAEGIVYRK